MRAICADAVRTTKEQQRRAAVRSMKEKFGIHVSASVREYD